MKVDPKRWKGIFKILEKDPEASLVCPICKKGDLHITEYRAAQHLLNKEAICVGCGAFSNKRYIADAPKEDPAEKVWLKAVDDFYNLLKAGRDKEAVKRGLKLLALSRRQNGVEDITYTPEVAKIAQRSQPALARKLRDKARREVDRRLSLLLATRNSDLIELADNLRTAGDLYLSYPAWKENEAKQLNCKAEAYFRKAAALSAGSQDRVEDAIRGVVLALRFRGRTQQARQLYDLHIGLKKKKVQQ